MEAVTFDSLNEDCIEELFDYLDLSSQINFALTSTKYADIFWRRSKRKLGMLNAKRIQNLPLSDVKKLLQLVGDNVELVELCGEFLPEIVEFCTDVKILYISQPYQRSFDEQIPKLAELKTLMALHYKDGLLNPTLETMIKTISTLPNLKYLHINCETYAGKHLAELKNLVALDLSAFTSLQIEYFPEFFSSSKNLRYLYLGHDKANASVSDTLRAAITQCQSLETLCMYNVMGPYLPFLNMPNLKGFHFGNGYITDNYLLPTLIDIKPTQLEALSLVNYFLSAAEVAAISRLASLQQLHCCVSEPRMLKKMSDLHKLQVLEVNCNNFYDCDILDVLKTYPKLSYLGIISDKITYKCIHTLVDFLKNGEYYKRPYRLTLGMTNSTFTEIKKNVPRAVYRNYLNVIEFGRGRLRNKFMFIARDQFTNLILKYAGHSS